MGSVKTYIPPMPKNSVLDKEYKELLTNNKTIIGAINELYMMINASGVVCGSVVSGEALCGGEVEGVESMPINLQSFLKDKFLDKFEGGQ